LNRGEKKRSTKTLAGGEKTGSIQIRCQTQRNLRVRRVAHRAQKSPGEKKGRQQPCLKVLRALKENQITSGPATTGGGEKVGKLLESEKVREE